MFIITGWTTLSLWVWQDGNTRHLHGELNYICAVWLPWQPTVWATIWWHLEWLQNWTVSWLVMSALECFIACKVAFQGQRGNVLPVLVKCKIVHSHVVWWLGIRFVVPNQLYGVVPQSTCAVMDQCLKGPCSGCMLWFGLCGVKVCLGLAPPALCLCNSFAWVCLGWPQKKKVCGVN